MSVIFFIVCTISLIILGVTAPDSVFAVMLGGAKDAIDLSFKMLAIYCIWLSVLQIVTASGLDKKIGKLLRPITKKIFKGESDVCLDNINLNITANLIGIGGVATPAGIKAIENMQKSSLPLTASHNMILFIVINATSIQLLPASIVGMRATAGSVSPSDIILPTLIATIISTALGMFLCKLCSKSRKQAKQKPSLVNSFSASDTHSLGSPLKKPRDPGVKK